MSPGERFNALSHLLGAGLALLGTGLLIALSRPSGDPWRVVSVTVYGVSLVAQYLSSFLYHAATGPRKPFLQKLDHCAIYLLIAGTYTPFTLVTLRGHGGWPLFATIASLALVGIAQEIWFTQRRRALSLAIYILMGWLAVVAIVPLVSALTYKGFLWLAAGGLLYTGGIPFYRAGKRGMRHGHGVWHLLVLAGSACHYLAVLFYVA
jgi:hemolysin III